MAQNAATKTRLNLHLDAVGGMAGDMFVAAVLDAFPDLQPAMLADVSAVLPAHIGEPAIEAGQSSGLRVLRFRLAWAERAPESPAHHGHGHDHHSHGHHSGSQGKREAASDYRSLRARIETAALSEGTAAHASAILRILAEAEAHIHGTLLDDVHFHEIGDWDSLMDVVAAGSLIAALEPAEWSVSDLPRGSGLVSTQHGLLPVPAPATAAILESFRWRDDGVAGERVTPTGAAILKHLCPPDPPRPTALGRLIATGTGAGTRDLKALPNIVRLSAFDAGASSAQEEIEVMCFDVDDMTGEEIAISADRLRAADGVIDLSLMTVQGKKGRPATRFQLLVRPDASKQVSDLVFLETSTLGVRISLQQRRVLTRAHALREGRRVKTAQRPGGGASTKIESDELADIAGLQARRDLARRIEWDDADDD
ncbi:UPF0272 protein [Rhizobium albus]|nr:UPF0272 protein [Rhizobium albus]